MYLISLYFDEKTNMILEKYQKRICRQTQVDYSIPFHITLLAFTSTQEEAIELWKGIDFQPFDVDFVSIGFLQSSLYCMPIMNDMLFTMHENLCKNRFVSIHTRYERNHWLQHVTLTKHLSKQNLLCAYQSIQYEFVPFTGKVVKIGLAKSSPYEDIIVR